MTRNKQPRGMNELVVLGLGVVAWVVAYISIGYAFGTLTMQILKW